MPVIDHAALHEMTWRPNYRKWDLAGPEQGVTSSLSYSEAAVGTGAPLHYHADDELIVILEGTLEVRLGDEVHEVGHDHTLVIPPNVPHGFTIVGTEPARLLTFFPVPAPFDSTTYLEGTHPGQTKTD